MNPTPDQLALDVNTGTDEVPEWTPVEDIESLSVKSDNPTTEKWVFHRSKPRIFTKPSSDSYSVGGFLNLGDEGQEALRTAARDRTDVQIRVRPDGVKGWIQTVRVGSRSFDVGAEDETQGIAFDFTGTDDAVGITGNIFLF